MRDITSQTLKFLNKTRGIELIVILGIQWVKNGPEILYSSQKIDSKDYPYPSIVEISNFDTIQTITETSDTQSISIILNDTDGKIKEIIDNVNICKQPVSVYFLFKGLSLDQKALFFTGSISTPIVWGEGDRTLSFEVLSEHNTIDVCFSMEEGDFPSIPEEALGKVWPLIFGQVCNMPTVKVRSPRRGILLSGEGIHDFTLETRLCQAEKIQCPAESKGEVTTINRATDVQYTEIYGMQVQQLYNETKELAWGPELSCVARRFETICKLLTQLQNQKSYEHRTLNISGGERFPQNTPVTINISGARFRGSFSGTIFTITDREHPEYADWDHIACHPINDRSYGIRIINGDISNWEERSDGTAYEYTGPAMTLTDCTTKTSASRESIGGPAASWEAYNEMESAGFHWCPAGSDVLLEDEREILYIVSLLPGTVDVISAYYKMPSGRKLLMEVPTDYYTVYNTNYTGYDVVELGLEKALSEYDENWDDEIYVSFTSTIGPNPVDIIEWLITKYTSYSIDATSFLSVKTDLANYPANFWIQERKSVLELIQDIAYQSRCGLYIRNNIIFLKYLAKEPISVRTITESGILTNTLKVKLSDTENIVTKHEILWKKTGAGVQSTDDINLKFILKHNIGRYNTHEDTHNYYTQNTYSTILKSSTFWMIRDSNIWNILEFNTPLTNLDLDIWDCIEIDTPVFSSKCIITQIQYDWENNTIHFEAWTPVLAGSVDAYSWAWPAAQNPLLTFPLPTDESQNAGYTFEVTPPIGHLLLGGDEATGITTSTGDRHPSDIDDMYPVITCEISDLVDIEEVYEEVDFEAQLAEQAAKKGMDESSTAGGGQNKNSKPETVCGSPDYSAGCKYEVIVSYITPTLVTSGGQNKCGGPCIPSCGPGVCTGSLSRMCHVFGAMFTANLFYMQKKLETSQTCPNAGTYCVGVTRPYGTPGKPRAICPPGEEGEELPGDSGAPNQSEITQPGNA